MRKNGIIKNTGGKMKQFKDEIIRILELVEKEEDNLKNIVETIVDTMQSGGKFYVFGTGHSHMIAEEFYARAGGLANIYMIAPLEVTLTEHPLKSTYIERIPEYAEVIYKTKKITSKDMLMICSNSGRNGCLIELANIAKRDGCKTIALTNITHSSLCTSRHPSGKRLFEVCDYVIDNHGCVGDAAIELDGVKGAMGSTSSIVGTYIAQTLNLLIAKELAKRGMEVPVFLSSNVDAGDEWNDSIMKKYYGI